MSIESSRDHLAIFFTKLPALLYVTHSFNVRLVRAIEIIAFDFS